LEIEIWSVTDPLRTFMILIVVAEIWFGHRLKIYTDNSCSL
jgi:hypothetical protein